jgi:fumarate hydratase class II
MPASSKRDGIDADRRAETGLSGELRTCALDLRGVVDLAAHSDPVATSDLLTRALIGEDTIVASAEAQGNFELNAIRPIIINNVLHSARILGDACDKLRRYSVEGTKFDQSKIDHYVSRSLMLVTALDSTIGYDKASAIAHKADDGTTLREAALALDVPAADFDRTVDPVTIVGHPRRDLELD